jgi:predicted  nucleic acid-binding Zn-ribbon protein
MSQPEILLRCSSCGAAIREPAMFCPECGKPLATAATRTEPALRPAINSEPVAAGEDQAAPAPVETVAAATDPETIANKSDQPDARDSQPDARGRTRERLQRASNAARGALEDNVKRVEKIHHVSTAIYEEAHYDPSLRFVLVALSLFVVFIILLVVSKVMG